MAIANFGGFETGAATEIASITGTAQVQTTVKRTGSYGFRSFASAGGVGYCTLGGAPSATGSLSLSFSQPIVYCCFYFRYATKPASDSEPILQVSGATALEVRLNSAGELSLYTVTTLIDSDTTVLAADTWYLIEFVFNDTANTQEVKLDGAVILTGTQATAGNFTNILLGKVTSRFGIAEECFYDDYAFSYDAAPTPGECKIGVPIGAGAASDWNDGTGTTFAEVDEIPPGSDGTTDTSYIGTDLNGDDLDHTFDMQSYSTIGVVGSIIAVKTMVLARTDSTTSTSAVAHRRLFNSSAFELTPAELTTSYALKAWIDETDPSGSGAITTADFDSIEVGMAANTIAQTQRFTVAYLGVWSTGVATAALTGTAVPTITEADVVTGGKTIIITLTDDTWIAAGAGSFDLQRDEIIAGLDSAQSELLGWDLVVKALQGLAGVVRTSDTVVTITLDAQATYNITATETITVTVPSTAVTGGVAITATPTFTVTPVGGFAGPLIGGRLVNNSMLVGGRLVR